jgi:polar amino acid transport system substrate-binding protein
VLADRFTAIQQAVAAPASRPADALQALFNEVEAIKASALLEAAFARAGQAVTLLR